MTVEQAKALIPDKDYVVYKGEICVFKKLIHEYVMDIEVPESGLTPCYISECQTLGEYRGCFDSTVLPPILEFEETSIDVISYNESRGMEIVYYNAEYSVWFTVDGEEVIDNFKWCFKPDYLKF